jgi:hypothetical protein
MSPPTAPSPAERALHAAASNALPDDLTLEEVRDIMDGLHKRGFKITAVLTEGV